MGGPTFNIGGPSDQARQKLVITVNDVGAAGADAAGTTGRPAAEDALNVWLEKRASLEREEAIVSDPLKLFELRKRIGEAQEKIQLLSERVVAGTGDGRQT